MSPNRLLFVFSHRTRGIRRLNDTIENPDLNTDKPVRSGSARRRWGYTVDRCSPTDPVRVQRIQRRDRIVICISHSSPDSNTQYTRDLPRFRGEDTLITSRVRRSFFGTQ